jgi:precorrin-4/cobalt-precorrin-4 C11-methyltransferase
MNSSLIKHLRHLLLIASAGIAAAQASPPAGKFYIVGMGTAPDLITVRAQRVLARANILMAEEGELRTIWADQARGKEVWEWPHSLRQFYGADPKTLQNPDQRALAEAMQRTRRQLIERIAAAVEAGKVVACLQSGDPMMFGMTLFLEMLPRSVPTEVVPGIGAFQAGSAALKMSPPYGYDTNAVILTMSDWQGRVDLNEKLMAAGSTMVFYTMNLDYPSLFAQLRRFYPGDTPVAVVCDAGDQEGQKVVRSTVSRFLEEVKYRSLPANRHILFVGKFLEVGQARKDFTPRVTDPSARE